jgi:Domain of unknown function (DUF4157)
MFAPRVGKPQAKTGGESNRGLAPRRSTQEQELVDGDTAPRDVETVLDGAGHSLDHATLGHFQTAFGHDFSTVRVHTDERAAASAASLSARAYTIGRHIVFGRREYEPGTGAGRRLLGHELAHVVQQSRGGLAPILPGHPGLEAAADHAADQAVRGTSVQVAGSSAVGIACKTLFEEFTGGRYSWPLLKGALEATRPVPAILDDLKPLGAYDRRQAIDDIVQERIARDRAHKSVLANQAAQADPQNQAFLDPSLVQGRRVIDRIDAVLVGLRTGIPGASIPGLNFTPGDYASLKAAGKKLTMAPDSGWFPSRLQDNLVKTLDLVLGPRTWPAATEGVNAMDFFHGHLVVKKARATEVQVRTAAAAGRKAESDLEKARAREVGDVSFARKKILTADKIGAYKAIVEQAEPALGTLMENAVKIPGAAVMYHTFEFNQPRELKAKGQNQNPNDPRRHYVTPLDTNVPAQYSPPAGGTYEREYTIIVRFSFLVDDQGAVHVRPMTVQEGVTTLELSTIAGTEYPLLEFE